MLHLNLIQKYNVPGPRYTSYPTVPFWDENNFSINRWHANLDASIKEHEAQTAISLYIHLPFCESLCTFCACNKHITRNHGVEKQYITYLLKEWHQLCSRFNSPPIIKELHLGGGTPTFFSPENINTLIESIMADTLKPDVYTYSVEGHPNNTTRAHLEVLDNLGFDRISFGVQDYAAQVQQAINRIQPFKRVQQVTNLAREVGFASVTHDLIFGLPHQTILSMDDTINKTLALRPDRIAFYSYAHVPWIKGSGQRAYNESDLPDSNTKRRIYEKARARLLHSGYMEIGMDHFALPDDRLSIALQTHNLHRNFMGYTENHTNLLIGLGVSAISDCWTAFSQNMKTIREYYARLDQNESPILRGHLLDDEDVIIRQHILNLMCNLTTQWQDEDDPHRSDIIKDLLEFEKDQLINIKADQVNVRESGRAFIRNICMAFDLRMKRSPSGVKLFSMTI